MLSDIAQTLLLIIDVQNDFCPGGALAVQDGDGVIAPLNALAAAFAPDEGCGHVAATQDWHPAGHISFASAQQKAIEGQVFWPDHCVQGTLGANFHEKLDLKPINLIIRKGFRKGLDSYSAFFENDRATSTGLAGWARGLGIETIIMGGLATDYCVFYSAMDAHKLGFKTIIAEDAVRGVNYPAGSTEQAIAQMRGAGIAFAPSAQLLAELHSQGPRQ